jgi:hypothetical protein
LKRATHFARGARADACGSCGGLRRPPALDNCAHHALSTKRRQTGIVMDVHPVLRGITEASQLQLPRPEPDEQPIESSQLERDDFSSSRHPALPLCLSMIFSENR